MTDLFAKERDILIFSDGTSLDSIEQLENGITNHNFLFASSPNMSDPSLFSDIRRSILDLYVKEPSSQELVALIEQRICLLTTPLEPFEVDDLVLFLSLSLSRLMSTDERAIAPLLQHLGTQQNRLSDPLLVEDKQCVSKKQHLQGQIMVVMIRQSAGHARSFVHRSPLR
jgi:hypothetical protein